MKHKNEDKIETMEMPCLCDCGAWFDLECGYPSKKSNKVICGQCHEREQRPKRNNKG